ncbi:MAG: nucleotidyltransferase domain-containing protein [Phocaeicola sp.]
MTPLLPHHKQLFSLLRSALWGEAVDATPFQSHVNWDVLLPLAHQQTLMALLYDPILTLPASLLPSKEYLRRMHLRITQVANSHTTINAVLTELTTFYTAQGVTPILLKGQGNASLYPNPLRRNCGDIDLYVGTEQYEKTLEYSSKLGANREKDKESDKHFHFHYKGIEIEIHRIAARFHTSKENNYFQELTSRVLQPECCNAVLIGDAKVLVPNPTYNALFIFLHTYYHFVTGGVGLRQLCDIAIFLKQKQKEINLVELHTHLEKLNLLKAWHLLGIIIVNQLGLPQDSYPFYMHTSSMEKEASKMLHIILSEGNFGYYGNTMQRRPKFFLLRKTYSFFAKPYRLFQFFPLAPSFVFHYYCFFVKEGIKRFVTDMRLVK